MNNLYLNYKKNFEKNFLIDYGQFHGGGSKSLENWSKWFMNDPLVKSNCSTKLRTKQTNNCAYLGSFIPLHIIVKFHFSIQHTFVNVMWTLTK